MNKALVDKLIQGYQQKDPRLFDILRLLSNDVASLDKSITEQINQLVEATNATTTSPDLLPPEGFTFSLPGLYLTLSWNVVVDAGFYEVRKGTDWATATLVTRTSSSSIQLDPVVAGSHTYLLKSINSAGIYSSAFSTLILTISTVGDVSVTYSVIDNNVLLYWTEPAIKSFNISTYEVYRNSVSIGTKPGTFTTVFETTAGVYSYGIKAYDLAGNSSALAEVAVDVKAPPDFDLLDSASSTFGGTKTNCILVGTSLLAPVVSETWEDHFIDNSFASIAAQIAAGYPLYIQPAAATATYEEKFDFGSVYTNLLITATWAKGLLTADDVDVKCELKYSDDDASYSAYVEATSIFGDFVRYIMVKLTFTPATTKALVYITNLRCLLDVKYATDSGAISAVSTDAGGTAVLFNKTFKDVNSITVSCNDVNPIYVVFDFTDVPDPTGFFVLAFNSAGVRVTKDVDWKARGVV
jgi:hypothetical protein